MNRWLSLGLVLTLGFLLGMLGFPLWDKTPIPMERVVWSPEAQWIAPQEPSYRFYARCTFYVPDTVQGAWLRLSADNDFILFVNGQPIAKETSVLNNSLGLASQLSDPFQRFNDSLPYHAPNAPETLITHTKDWKLAAYVDLTPYLRPGKNVIALEIQKSQKNPRVVVQGAVYPAPGASINLTTGTTAWRSSTLGENHQQIQWFEPDFPDQSWSDARAIGPVQEVIYSRVSQHLFDRLLQGSWITGTESLQGEVWLRGRWNVPRTRQRAFIRFAGDSEYALIINGLLVSPYKVDGTKIPLHLYEVTNLLHTGVNNLAVRLERPLEQNLTTLQEGPLRFFLDGWVETPDDITALIATDSTWSSLTQPISGWSEGSGQGQPAVILGPPNPQEFQRTFEGDASLLNYPNNILHSSLWQLGGMGFALVFAWGLGYFWLDRRHGWWNSLGVGAGLLLPGTLFLIGTGLLKHRYAEVERGFLFSQPQSTPLVFLGFVVIVFLTLSSWIGLRSKDREGSVLKTLPRWGLWFLFGLITTVCLGIARRLLFSQSPIFLLVFLSFLGIVPLTLLYPQSDWRLGNRFRAALQAWPLWGHQVLLALIVSIGFVLRVHNLDFQNLDSDESTSLDATRGILRTGVPQAVSHIWYTRSPAYHYMLALWLRLVGDSVTNARFLSVLWGTATLILLFIFARKVTGKLWIALVVTAIFAINPWVISASRYIRFYQVVQFLILLSFLLFLKGFVDREGRGYQHSFFIAITFAVLTQEVTITLFPAFLIGFLFFYRPFRLTEDWSIILGSVMTVVIVLYDVAFCEFKMYTPWVALSTTTDSIISPHLLNVTTFIGGFFFGFTRMHIIYGFFFFLGFAYFLKRQNGKLVFLFSSVFITLTFLTILVMQIANRYAYSIYPLFVLLSIYSAICIMEDLGKRFEALLENEGLPLRKIALACVALLLICNLEIDKLIAGYQDTIVRRNTEVFEYIREHRQPGDVVVSSSAPPAALNLGGLDYYMPISARFDTVYWNEGQVIDRWGGGVLVTNLDQLSHVLEEADRAWIHIDGYSLVKLSPPLAKLRSYVETLGQPVIESFGTRINLWQREDGLLPRVPNEGKDLGSY